MTEILAPGVKALRRTVPSWLVRHETMLAAILIAALIVLGALNNRVLTLDNLLNQGRLMTELGLIALPMTFVVITGGIDLSVGSTVGLCAILCPLCLVGPHRQATRKGGRRGSRSTTRRLLTLLTAAGSVPACDWVSSTESSRKCC